MKYKLLAILSLLFGTLSANAIVAKKGMIEARQPDGTTINVRMEGGPRGHNIFNADNQLLMTDDKGFYVPADESFKTRVQEEFESRRRVRQKGPGLMDRPFPSLGDQKALVILVEFADNQFTIDNPKSYYEDMLNGEDFSDDSGATGSARHYFRINSNDEFNITFDVYGPVKLTKEMAYYGGNDWYGEDKYPYQMIIDACEILDQDPQMDFSQYDKNNDGFIDIVYVFYAGYGEADGGGPDTIWPHSYEIYNGEYITKFFDGKQLNHYACSNELQYSSSDHSRMDGIGTFCHEFCHVLGLPDVYSTIGGGAFTPDEWDLLDGGSYNNMSRTPPYLSSFERYALDWIVPEEITAPGTYRLNPIGTSNEAIIVKTDRDNEYFLLENRQQRDWDTYLPHHGMIVWHIHYDQVVWNNNTVNVNPKHQYIDLIEADGIPSNWTRDGDAFPGLYEVEQFTSTTNPAFVSWSGRSLGFDIKNIKEHTDGTISFDAVIPGTTAAEQIESDSDKVRYFNLQGMEILNPSKGELLIEIRGNSSRKVIL